MVWESIPINLPPCDLAFTVSFSFRPSHVLTGRDADLREYDRVSTEWYHVWRLGEDRALLTLENSAGIELLHLLGPYVGDTMPKQRGRGTYGTDL